MCKPLSRLEGGRVSHTWPPFLFVCAASDEAGLGITDSPDWWGGVAGVVLYGVVGPLAVVVFVGGLWLEFGCSYVGDGNRIYRKTFDHCLGDPYNEYA